MQPILQHLFQVSSLDELTRQQLESFVEEYPSFGIGHYLLSRKLKSEGSEKYAMEAQRTSLYFTNPFWLQWQLDHAALGGGQPSQPAPAAPAPVEESFSTPAEEPVVAAASVVTVAEESFEGPAGDDLAEALSTGLPAEPSAAEVLLRSIEEARGLRDTLVKLNTDFDAETSVAGESLPAEEPVVLVEQLTANEEPTAHEEPIHDEEPPFVLDEAAQTQPGPVAEQATPNSEPATAEPAPVPTLPGQPVDSGLVFEPYHTIDYFASQGIKFTLDENPKDKLGKQLKSFTEWLKGMRRLPQKDREVIPDRVAEEAVQNIAAHSIESKDVLTETMAEVLAMQGMRERARVVYEKLSLLNPGKRAYFAAKIEQLNIP